MTTEVKVTEADIIKHAKSDLAYVEGLEVHLDQGDRCGGKNIRDLIAIIRWNANTLIQAYEGHQADDATVEKAIKMCPEDACGAICQRCGGRGWIVDLAAIAAMREDG